MMTCLTMPRPQRIKNLNRCENVPSGQKIFSIWALVVLITFFLTSDASNPGTSASARTCRVSASTSASQLAHICNKRAE